VPHKHLYSRISYLHQAATYLATAGGIEKKVDESLHAVERSMGDGKLMKKERNESRRLLGHLRGVSLKSQIRLSPKLKHTICKRCDSLMTPGDSSTERIKNDSRNGEKPWADVLEIQCKACGTVKRFPVGLQRQKDEKLALKVTG